MLEGDGGVEGCVGGKAEAGVRSTGANFGDRDVEQRYVCDTEDIYIYYIHPGTGKGAGPL